MRKVSPLRGKLKGLFFVLRLDRLHFKYLLSFFAHISYLSAWIAKHKKECGYSDFYSYKFDYDRREGLFEHVIKTENIDGNIDYLEFGVSRGRSFEWWLNRIENPDARFYGFDTFSGLPEDWGPFKKGDMDNGDEPPKYDDNRYEFFQGLFQQTLLPFLQDYKSDKRKVIHMDADLYSATLYVLATISPILKPGDIIFFDEFNVPMHEFKAFKEWTASFYIDYEVLGGVNNFYQVAIKIK
ncbi:MAG: class I SAM-dependent methyltransferase [Crocinitomicaceae bacterium]|nr:class I SAM-dependent methyltransferase [Crocinitomicaceae bacterium]